MKNHKNKSADEAPISFPRADPAALAQFDERTKNCHMQCGPHALDPRSRKERLFLCIDCCVEPRLLEAETSKAEAWVSVTRELDEADSKLWVEVARQMAVLWEPLGPVGNGRLRAHRFTGTADKLFDFAQVIVTTERDLLYVRREGHS